MRVGVLLLVLLGTMPHGSAAQSAVTAAPKPPVDSAEATWNTRGLTIRFPRSVSPDSITYDTRVADAFSGFEWRVILITDQRPYMAALVITPSDSLTLTRVPTIAEAYRVGDLRSCDRTTGNLVLRCSRLAQGLVRDVEGRLEIAIVDTRWLQALMTSRTARVHLVVKVAKETVWEEERAVAWSGAARP
jgi:hypothetical protein